MSWRMKRFYWLLALPYFVVWDTTVNRYLVNGSTITVSQYSIGEGYYMKFMADDMSTALNEAHERRISEGRSPNRRISDVKGSEKDPNLTPPSDPNLYWKDSKKADWEHLKAIGYTPTMDTLELRHITNKEACGQSDCGKEP